MWVGAINHPAYANARATGQSRIRASYKRVPLACKCWLVMSPLLVIAESHIHEYYTDLRLFVFSTNCLTYILD